MQFQEERSEEIRKEFPKGCTIALDRGRGIPYPPIPAGILGTVVHVDRTGTVHCRFENGRMFGLIPGRDRFHRVCVRREKE